MSVIVNINVCHTFELGPVLGKFLEVTAEYFNVI
jgi:hypothetical protein